MPEGWIKRAATRVGLLGASGKADSFDEGEVRELQGEIKEKSRRLRALRKRLEERDRVVEELRARLIRDTTASTSPLRQETPVFFLVGRAKSGTSWLMRTLDAHPEILCRGEGRIFGRDYRREDIKGMQSKTIQPSSLYRAILDAEYLNAWIERSVWTRGDDADRHLTNLTRLAANYFLTEKLAQSGKRIVGDKTPFLSADILQEIGEIYPGAKVIHIIRDGRDVAVSSMHHLWKHSIDLAGHQDLEPEEIEKRDAYRADPQAFVESGEGLFTEKRLRSLAGNWSEVVRKARHDGPRLLGKNYTETRYEDLLWEPEEEVARLLRFLGADASEEVVRACVESASFERWSRGRQRGREDSMSLLRKGVAGDWKGVFTVADRSVFKEAAGEALVELGYEKAHDW